MYDQDYECMYVHFLNAETLQTDIFKSCRYLLLKIEWVHWDPSYIMLNVLLHNYFYCCAASHLSLRGATPCSGGTCEPAHSFSNTHTCGDKFNFLPSACELVMGNTRQEVARALKVEDELIVEKVSLLCFKSRDDDNQWKLCEFFWLNRISWLH